MNINKLNFLPLKINNVQNKNQPTHYLTNSNTDTFEKSNAEITFNGRQAKAKQIIQKGTEKMSFAAFVGAVAAAAYTAYENLVAGKNQENLEIDPNTFKDFFAQRNKENNDIIDVEKEQIREELVSLRQENKELKEKLKIQETDQNNTKNITTDAETVADNELVKAEFPKKHGRFTKEQTALKNMVEQLVVPKATADKLAEICHTIIINKENTLEKYGFDTKYFLEEIPKHTDNLNDFNDFIDKIYEGYKNPKQEKTQGNNASESSEEIYIPEGERDAKMSQKKEPKIIGKLSLDKQKTTPSLSSIDDTNGIYDFRIGGTVSNNIEADLKTLLSQFQKKTKSNSVEKVKWMHRDGLPERVLTKDVQHEIDFRKEKASPYKHLGSIKAETIADLINNEPRFKELFDIHSTLRFIDRYIDFNDEVHSIEEQCSAKLDLLFNAIQKALSNGTKIESYQDPISGVYAARMIIDADKNKNPEAYQLAGTAELKITICERRQEGKYNPLIKRPLISTIFSKF